MTGSAEIIFRVRTIVQSAGKLENGDAHYPHIADYETFFSEL